MNIYTNLVPGRVGNCSGRIMDNSDRDCLWINIFPPPPFLSWH